MSKSDHNEVVRLVNEQTLIGSKHDHSIMCPELKSDNLGTRPCDATKIKIKVNLIITIHSYDYDTKNKKSHCG